MATRHERVVLELDDRFSSRVAKAAAATALLNKELNSLSGSAVRSSGIATATRDMDNLGTSSRRVEADINKLSGRLALFGALAGALGPGLVPITTVAIPALAGLAAQLGVVAGAAGVTLLSFQGVGDAFEAVGEAQIEPTTANLEKARAAMERLAPSAQAFVMQLQEMRPAFAAVRDAGAEELFPALSASFVELESVLPRVESLFASFGSAAGEVSRMVSGSLASGEWNEFIDFMSAEAEPTLTAVGSTVGSLAMGMAELVMAMDPLSDGFTGWLQDAAQGFEDWAAGVDQTEGFRELVSYIQQTGPQVADTMGAVANAILQIGQAAAPLGGPVLQAIEGIANALAMLADSEIGTPLLAAVAAMSALRLATTTWAAVSATSFGAILTGQAAVGAGYTTLAARAATFGASLAALGPAAAAATLALGSINDALDMQDSMARSSEATDSYSNSVAELASNLQTSNVGKFAQDLGIDVQLLAQDLFENGKQGEYAAEVFAKLGDASSGADAFISQFASNSLPILHTEADKSWEALDDLNDIFGKIETSTTPSFMGEVANAALRIAASSTGLSDILQDQASAFDDAVSAARRYQDALGGLSGFLNQKEALLAYERALTQLTRSMKNGFTRQDQENLYNYGRTIEQVATSIEGAGKRSDFLQGPIKALRAMSEEAGPRARGEIDDLIQRLVRLDRTNAQPKVDADEKPAKKKIDAITGLLRVLNGKSATPKVSVNDQPAMAAITRIASGLRGIPDETVNVRINRLGDSGIGPARVNDGAGADGATVHGPRSPYGDKMLYAVAPGEEIISNRFGQADRNRALLKAINDGRYGADGRTVGIGTAVSQDIGTAASLDINPFASSLHDLTQIAAQEYDSRALQLDRTDKQFAKILEDRAERARKEADADKSRLKAMIETQRAFEEQVSGLFKSDVFQKGETQWVATFPDGSVMELGTDVDSISGETGAYLAQAGATITQQSGFDPLGGLQGDIANIEEAMRLYQELRARGFDGPAFRELAASADVATLQQMAAMTNAELQQTERLFEQRDQLAGNLGQQVGQDFNPELKELRREFQTSNQIARRMEQKADRANQRLDNINTRLTSMERTLPANTGAAVGAAVNGAAANGAAGRGGSAGGRGGR